MSKDPNQNFGAPPTGGQYQNQMNQPYQAQPNQYGQAPGAGNPGDAYQAQQNYYQPGQNQTTASQPSYPGYQAPPTGAAQPSANYPGQQPQQMQGYYQGYGAPAPTQTPSFPDNSQAKVDPNAQNLPSQPTYPQAQNPERQQNTFSHHETSAPVGVVQPGQQNFRGVQRQDAGQRQDPNAMGVQPSQFRPDMNSYQGYMQPPAAQPQPTSQPLAPESQVLGGFLGQSAGQAAPPAPSQTITQPTDPSRQGMSEGMPTFQLNPDMSASGNPPIPGAQAPPPIDLGAGGLNADPSTMDIGALNRMAEYYATNSDYPKVSIPTLNYRLSSTSRR